MKKVLIANRGEIAVRVIRACQELGLKTVAIHSVADKDSLHAKLADESVCIGPGPSIYSYLQIPNIMCAAEVTGVMRSTLVMAFLLKAMSSREFAEPMESSLLAQARNKSGLLEIKSKPEPLRLNPEFLCCQAVPEQSSLNRKPLKPHGQSDFR